MTVVVDLASVTKNVT